MQANRHPWRALAAGLLAALALLGPFAQAQRPRLGDHPDPVVVRLRARAQVSTRTVSVADVAELSGGLPMLRDSIGKLDLADVPRDGFGLRVSRRQLLYRLQLTGIPTGLYRVEGAEAAEVAVHLRPLSSDEVVAAARQALLARLPWSPDEVVLDLVQPVAVPLPHAGNDEAVVIKAEPHPGHRPPGRMQVDVRIFVQGEQRLALAVCFNVRPCQKVLVCRRRIEPGEELSPANVYVDQQPLDHRSRLVLSPDAGRGKKARRALMPGQPVLMSDIEDTSPQADDRVLVKANEGVKVLLQVGVLRVTAAAQALQDGKRGQLIRVQNVDSKKILLARVLEAGLVEVE